MKRKTERIILYIVWLISGLLLLSVTGLAIMFGDLKWHIRAIFSICYLVSFWLSSYIYYLYRIRKIDVE